MNTIIPDGVDYVCPSCDTICRWNKKLIANIEIKCPKCRKYLDKVKDTVDKAIFRIVTDG